MKPTPALDASHSATPSLEQVLADDNAQSAWARVRRNRGCAGVDGVSVQELEPQFAAQWRQVERTIASGNYQPRPLLRVRIPKPSGGERLLGIPTVMDRVVQQSVAQVLSPRWEPRFSSRSFAYRPGRGPRHALAACEAAMGRGSEWVLHLDIESFFDSVPHAVTLSALKADLADVRVETLIQRTLTCGVYEDALVRATTVGFAQGSPLSPLLANVVLDRFDRRVESTGWEFVRYADDCVIFLPRPELGPAVKRIVVQTLGSLGLRLNEQKTSFGPFTSARFLGFTFRRDASGRAVRSVSPEALAEAESSILGCLHSSQQSEERVASVVAGMLRSWLAYFRTTQDEPILRRLVERIRAAWQEKFPGAGIPAGLCWDSLARGGASEDRLDYSGHFQKTGSGGAALDWTESWHCLLQQLLRSRWWHLEYDLAWGKRADLRLCLGRHRINLRF